MQKYYNKKGKLNKLKASLLLLMLVCFALPVKAQNANPSVYMRDGRSLMDAGDAISFYDSHGPSGPSTDAGVNYWDFWYVYEEQFEYTFKARNATDLILVTFNTFPAYAWNNAYQNGQPNHLNCVTVPGDWSLRINDDILTVYQGESSTTGTIIGEFSGNKEGVFTMMAQGSITFNFYSNNGYREEGWAATVQCLDGTQNTFVAQPPFIRRSTCSNTIEILPTTVGATVYYTIDGTEPTASSNVYSTPIDWPSGNNLTVKAKSSIDGGTTLSSMVTMTFNDAYQPDGDRLPNPGQPTITREEGTNIITMKAPDVPSGVNETYIVRYTTNGTEPTYSGNGITYTEPIVCSEAGTVYTAKTFALSCELASISKTYTVSQIYCPKPKIDFDNMTITAYDENNTPFHIYYTTDGNEPSASQFNGEGNGTVNLTNLALGTTIKAIAYKLKSDGTVDTNYTPSLVATDVYVGSGSQVDPTNGIVLLDDREDHGWSYYSDEDQPVHRLNPTDVKITYFGNGVTMKTNADYTSNTSSNDYEVSTGVAVGVDASANQFVYLKTLENAKEDGTGNYPYTMIPNPFSKRPIYGNGDTRWRGFQGWRVKRLIGVTISEGYVVGDIIPAEKEITFVTDNSEGNEADFEAVWARAYVNTSNSTTGLSGGSYERNFIVGATPSSALSVPVTYSRYYPDGTGGANTVNIGNFTCSADTKFEYMNLNNGTLTANNHDLIMGRGLTGTASVLQGINADATDLDYTIRVESGLYSQLTFVRTSGTTVSGRYYVRGIMGCDYDRAGKVNSNLSVSKENNLFFSTSVTFSSSANRNAKTFDLVVKSGEYQENYWYNQAAAPTNAQNPQGGGWQSSFYCGQNQGTNNYQGNRYVVVEGGEFGCMNGGRGTSATSATYDPTNNIPVVTLRIKGGLFHGAVYGGAADSETRGDRAIIITGGEIQGWVAGANNGTGTQNGSSAAVVADAYVYVGGTAIIGGENANAVNVTNGGQVYGAGRGRNDQRASVVNSYVVIADDATISNENNTSTYPVGGNVYGGGNYGYVTNTSNVYILGGTIQNHVFGGAYGNSPITNYDKIIPTSNVYVKGGTVNGSVYGGSNSSGTVTNSHITVSGVDKVTNVFGGGLGVSTIIGENTTVNVNGGTINNNVYGGGEEGTVEGNTEVTVSGGTMKDVYGAGKGSSSSTADISGTTEVTVSGGSVANVYGGGEAGNVVVETEPEPVEPQTKKIIVTVYGNHNENDNRRARLTFTPANSISPTNIVRWPQRNNPSSGTETTLTVSCDQIIRATFSYQRTPTGLSFSIKSEDGSITYWEETTQPDNNAYKDFTVESDPIPPTPIETELKSTVTVSGGAVSGDVFGGGKMGKTFGDAIVTVSGGAVSGNVFGGAYGEHGSIFLAGLKTVNITGGSIHGSVYGGSRNANDALEFTTVAFYHEDENGNKIVDATDDEPCSITNVSGGDIREHVYAAGYYGVTYGSVYAFVGLDAIESAPNHSPIEGIYNKAILNIGGNVYAGGDWGTFNGTFGAPTVSGNSSVYVDGLGYNTTSQDATSEFYMNIGSSNSGGSIFGCGTSCDAGNMDRTLILKNYGTDVANSGSDASVNPVSAGSRTFNSIQRFRTVVADKAHVNFKGQGMVNSLNATVEYALFSIDNRVYLTNGSTFVMNAPSTELKSFYSVTCDDTYAATPSFSQVSYNGLGDTGSTTDNKIRVNGGSYIEILYETTENNATVDRYGELAGWAHMMSSNQSSDMTCAYARPKQSQETGNIIPDTYDNPGDGGFVSYDAHLNNYTADGALAEEGGSDQLRYENHTTGMRGDSQYYRIWRYGGNHSTVRGVLNAESVVGEGAAAYYTVEDTIKLPSWRGSGYYYRFETSGDNYLVDFGNDVLTYNAAYAYKAANADDPNAATGSYWMYNNNSDEQVINQPVGAAGLAEGLSNIGDNPNMNFGLVMVPYTAIQEETSYIICDEADTWLAANGIYHCGDNTAVPSVIFRLTYKNALTANMSWDPITIPLVQCHMENGVEVIDDYVNVMLTINTSTQINEGISTTMWAMMNGSGGAREVSQAKLIIPSFSLHENGENAEFFVKKIEFTEGDYDGDDPNGHVVYAPHSGQTSFDFNTFGMTIEAVATPDNIDDWRNKQGEIDGAPGNGGAMNALIADAGGRSDLALGINLYYNGNVPFQGNKDYMGRVVFTIVYNNSGLASSAPYETEFTITVDVYRRGRGLNYYVDGTTLKDGKLLGQDATGYGKFPDKPARTVNYVLNRLGFLPGDNIFVVNTLPITKPSTTWDGSRFQNQVNIYRYPGRHKLSSSDETPVIFSEDFPNDAFTGPLVDVTTNLNVIGVNVDGMYAEATATTHNHWIYPSDDDNGGTDLGCVFDGLAEAPLMIVEQGGTANLKTTTAMKNNYNTWTSQGGDKAATIVGGAVNVNRGGILKLNGETKITDNICEQGAGVYMDGAMIVSDSIYVYNNKTSVATDAEQSNVWLTEKGNDNYRVVQIGLISDYKNYGALKYRKVLGENILDTKLGIGKDDWENGTIDGFMPVVYAEPDSIKYLEIPFANPQNMIVHDLNHYKLEKYDPDYYLYWLKTWVTEQYWNPIFASNKAAGYTPYMTAEQLQNIDTPEKLAWVISLANGENGVDLNDEDYVLDEVIVTKDLDMSQYIWVPIGTDDANFEGTFEGNGYTISGLISPLERTDAGMFGQTTDATIQNMVVVVDDEAFKPTAENAGVVVGTMNGGTLSNIEAAGTVNNRNENGNTGGLVGTNNGGTIHSSFAVASLTGGNTMGGLVAVNKGNLYNSYSNVTIDGSATVKGGLVGVNNTGCFVENCYAQVGSQSFPAFANANNGTIQFCYADTPNDYVTTSGSGENVKLEGHGTYDDVEEDIKSLDYMFYDNLVDLEGDYTTYVPDVTEGFIYDNNHIPVWDGLLSALNKWVRGHEGYTSWNRPINSAINGDLPVLCFPKDNAMATLDSDGKFLQYGTELSSLLTDFNAKAEASSLFHYGNALDVDVAPASTVKVTVNEDAVLMPTVNNFTATVGVTFDNSCGNNYATYTGAPLTYDWHFMSTSLKNAPINATYGATTGFMNPANITGMDANCYFPNGLFDQSAVTWDFYTYSEEFHHWVNLKRTDHFYQENGLPFTYNNETSFEPGKGYMMAISQDSYMNSTGVLNNADVEVTLTNKESQHLDTEYNEGWNLVGNPYQAYLDLDALLNDDDNFYEENDEGKPKATQAYVYDADLGVYTPYVEAASENPAIIQQFVHPHQGFFVHSEKESTTLTFKPAMAKATDDAPYFRGDDRVNYPLVNLFAENAIGNRDLAVIEFNRPELGGATKVNGLRNANFQVAASLEGHRYGLVFTPEGTEKVPVHFTTEENGTFTLTWETLHGDFTSLLLVDNMTGTITDMLRADHYTFDATTDDYASRFYITYTVTGVDEYNEGDGTFAFFDGSAWVVDGKGMLDVVDVQGRTLYSERLVNDKNRVSLNGVAAGVYLLRVSDGTNTMVQKIVVK